MKLKSAKMLTLSVAKWATELATKLLSFSPSSGATNMLHLSSHPSAATLPYPSGTKSSRATVAHSLHSHRTTVVSLLVLDQVNYIR